MSELALLLLGVASGVTTVLFGFGGGFVTVPVMVWANVSLGEDAPTVAVATSAAVMVVNAAVATAATPRDVRALLRRTAGLVVLLAVGGAAGAVLARWVPGQVITWLFVGYLVVTIADVLLRKGFVRLGRARRPVAGERFAIPAALGLPIGAVAAFLGVGGSMMTVPLLRRAGHGMHAVAALANALTLAISVPASLVFLLGNPVRARAPGLVGAVDLPAAALLLAGANPLVILLRRHPPRIPDRAHAIGFVVLLVLVLVSMVWSALA